MFWFNLLRNNYDDKLFGWCAILTDKKGLLQRNIHYNNYITKRIALPELIDSEVVYTNNSKDQKFLRRIQYF